MINSVLTKVDGSSITLVIKLLKLLPEISESQFQGWMADVGFSWALGDHKKLADLLLERKWSITTKKLRWSWKRELQLVAWHASELLPWPDKFWIPPEDANQSFQHVNSNVATGSMGLKKEMKILFLAANPIASGRLALDEEARSIEEKVRSSKHRDSVIFRSCWAVRPADLQQAILEEDPTVVHFSGHGGGTIGIVMHSDSMGDESLVTSDMLTELLRVLKDGIR